MEVIVINSAKKKLSPERSSGVDRVYDVVNYIFLGILLFVSIYPMIIVLSSSFSDPNAVMAGKVWLYPIGFTLEGYEAVIKYPLILSGYLNTIFYTGAGTLVNVLLTVLAAYPLSRKDFKPRRPVMLLFTFTMFFSGGMVPSYILVSRLNLLNTRWALILPTAMSVYNMILMRTYFQNTIQPELLEVAQLDGCTDIGFVRRVVLPLSKPILAVIAMYYAIAHWNAYFNAFMYLSTPDKYPLQLVLRSILIQNQVDMSMVSAQEMLDRENLKNLLKYSLIVVSSVPVLLLYPQVQKHFVKGVMIGSIKG